MQNQYQTQIQPPQVPMDWLNYIHKNANSPEALGVCLNLLLTIFLITGQWPVLPDTQGNGNEQTSTTAPSTLNLTPTEAGGSEPKQGTSTPPTGYNPKAYQYGFPQMVGTMTTPPLENEKKKRQPATGYDYVHSTYFQEATKLIEEHVKRPLSFESKLVFSVILAWCNFPLFKEMSNRQGEWMTLSAIRLAKEVGMHVTRFLTCVNDLQGAGLIEVASQLMPFASRGKGKNLPDLQEVGQSDTDTALLQFQVISRDDFTLLKYDARRLAASDLPGNHFFRGRSIQEKNWTYALKFKPRASQPVFNPFQRGTPQENQPESLGNLEKEVVFEPKSENRSESLESTENPIEPDKFTENEVSITCGLVPSDADAGETPTCMNESMDECMTGGVGIVEGKNAVKPNRIPISTITPGTAARVQAQIDKAIQEMNPIQRAKYRFLHHEARFNGYQDPNGKETLDQIVCNGFAYNPALTLEQIQDIYDHVRERWSTGQVKKTPLGLLHQMLKEVARPGKEQEQEQVNGDGDGATIRQHLEPRANSNSSRGQEDRSRSRARGGTLAGNGKNAPNAPIPSIGEDDKWHFK